MTQKKHKYFYNGKLVRTSTHDYKYGLLRNGSIIKCSATIKGCEAEKTSELNFSRKQAEWLRKNEHKDPNYSAYAKDHEDFIKNTKWEIVELTRED